MLRAVLTAALAAMVTVGCAGDTRRQIPPAQVALTGIDQIDNVGETTPVGDAPATKSGLARLPTMERRFDLPQQPDLSARFATDDKKTIAVAAMPMRQFLNYVFGELLKVSFIVADGAPGLDAPVTFNTQAAISSRQLFNTATEILVQNNLALTEREGVFFIGPASGVAGGDTTIGYGSKPTDVPNVAGKILQVIPLRYGYNIAIERTASQLAEVAITLDPQQGALFVSGSRTAILKVLDVVRLLDQPTARSSGIGILNLTYIGSREFIEQLIQLLGNEGIPAGVGRADGTQVALVPLDQLGSVAVFATSAQILDRVEFWAQQIDKPSQGPSLRYFIYQPKNARAADLGASLAPLIGGGVQTPQQGNRSRDTRSAIGNSPSTPINSDTALRRDGGSSVTAEAGLSIQGDGVTLSVDPRSNSLIFYTTGLRYEALLPMIRRLDVPPKQILLEATIAEVSLTGEFANGVEFAFQKDKVVGGTAGRIGLPAGGIAFSYVTNVTDQVFLRLQQSDSRVNVLSNPMLVVRDGVPAQISVGNDVPTVGATATDPLLNDRAITTVLYRKTGLDLTIRPTINSQGLVVMELQLSSSNTVPGSSGVSGAPTFFQRQVSTEVVARSGQSVLLAGLVSETDSDNSSRVPWVSRLPGVGALFRSDGKKSEKTELVLLITPRIIDTPDEWDSIRGGLERALKYLAPPPPPVVAPPAVESVPSADPAPEGK
jgi:general secretion pathway protein D